MRIDAHHHLWDLTAVHYPWILDKTPRFFGDHTPIRRDYLLPEFKGDADQHGFKGSVHIQVGAADPLVEANWIDNIARENSDWPMVQVAFCDMTEADFVDQLKALQKLPSLRGIRQIVGRSPEEDAQTGTNDLLDNPRFLDGLKRIGDLGLAFDLQLIPELMPRMGELIEAAPDTQIALCHAGSPYDRSDKGLARWAELLRAISECQNVFCKLSGLGMFDHDWTADKIAPIVETVFAQFGQDRVMYGSNFPVDSLSSDYASLIDAYTSLVRSDARDAFFGKNAQKFYNIETT